MGVVINEREVGVLFLNALEKRNGSRDYVGYLGLRSKNTIICRSNSNFVYNGHFMLCFRHHRRRRYYSTLGILRNMLLRGI